MFMPHRVPTRSSGTPRLVEPARGLGSIGGLQLAPAPSSFHSPTQTAVEHPPAVSPLLQDVARFILAPIARVIADIEAPIHEPVVRPLRPFVRRNVGEHS